MTLLLPTSHFVTPFIAYPALPISRRSGVSVFWRVFVSFVAMRFSKIRTHFKTLKKYFSLWIKQFFESFASFCSFNYGIAFKARNISQNRNIVSNALNRHFSSVSSIILLIFSRCPSAIFRRIWAVIIYAINSKTFRSFSHVLNKCGKTVFPSFANKNTSSAIIKKTWAISVIASSAHTFPDSIKRMLIFKWHGGIVSNAIKYVKETSNAF